MGVKIYTPEGNNPQTSRVSFEEIETHIQANDQLSGEAKLLKDFAAADGIPSQIGEWSLESEGRDEEGQFYRYIHG